jgi:hypothetical protein
MTTPTPEKFTVPKPWGSARPYRVVEPVRKKRKKKKENYNQFLRKYSASVTYLTDNCSNEDITLQKWT